MVIQFDWKKCYKNTYCVLILLFILVIAIYGRTLWGDFVFDDRGIVEHYNSLSNPLEIKEIFGMPYWTQDAGLYRPFTLYTYSLNYFFLGTSSFGFHFINLILYWLICSSLFIFIKRLFNSKVFAFISALIFLVLPIHTEVVSNIIGRAEIMALLFSLFLLIEFTRKEISSWRVCLWLFLAISSKETAIAVIPIAFMVAYFTDKERIGTLLKKYLFPTLSILSASVLYFSLRLMVLGSELLIGVKTSMVENPLIFSSATERILTAFKVLSMYIGKSIVPVNLCSDYSYNQIPIVDNILNIESFLGLIIFLGLIFSIFYFINRQPVISLSSSFFFFAFLPISNLLFPIGTIAGERLMFYPSVGIAMFISFIFLFTFHILKEKKVLYGKITIIILIAIFLIYSFVSIRRSGDWFSEKKLFTDAALCAPNSTLSLSNMGTVYYFEGKYDEAEKKLLDSINIYDGYSKGLNNLGLVYWKKNNNKKALEYYNKAINTKYPYPGAYENIALLYISEGNIEQAKKWLRIFFSNDESLVNAYLRR